eukprot:m.10966 g.10966  ORF g.10966 m.10966 type:complete len:627 (+) comp5640_c0_seq1:36-1916(+)
MAIQACRVLFGLLLLAVAIAAKKAKNQEQLRLSKNGDILCGKNKIVNAVRDIVNRETNLTVPRELNTVQCELHPSKPNRAYCEFEGGSAIVTCRTESKKSKVFTKIVELNLCRQAEGSDVTCDHGGCLIEDTMVNVTKRDHVCGHVGTLTFLAYSDGVYSGITSADSIVAFQANVQTLSFPNLQRVGSMSFSQTMLQSVQLPQLVASDGLISATSTSLTAFYAPLLESVGGIYFDNCPSMVSVKLPALNTSTGSVEFQFNDALSVIELPSFERVDGDFAFDNLPALTSVSLPEFYNASGHVVFDTLPLVESISLPKLEFVGSDVKFVSNANLIATSAPGLTYIGEHLRFDSNAMLSLLYFPLLEVAGIQVMKNPSLQAFVFPSLRTTPPIYPGNMDGYDITILDNLQLSSAAFPNLINVTDEFAVRQNPVLVAIDFSALVEVVDGIYFRENARLAAIDFPSLVLVQEYFQIWNVYDLASVTAPLLQHIGNYFDIDGCDKLYEVIFPELVYVGDYLGFYNDNVLRLVNFPKLAQIDDGLYFYDNARLETVLLNDLHTIEGGFEIYRCPKLELVDMLSLTAINGYFVGIDDTPANFDINAPGVTSLLNGKFSSVDLNDCDGSSGCEYA